VVKSIEDVTKEAQCLLGSVLVTHQTGPHGKQVNRLYIEEGSTIDREFYPSALVDRTTSRVAFVVSTAGGMEIEEVARTEPEKIISFSVDPATSIMPHHGRRAAKALGLTAISASRPKDGAGHRAAARRRRGPRPSTTGCACPARMASAEPSRSGTRC